MVASVELARSVRDEVAGTGRRLLVAASVGPYGAVLADGSEYRGRYGVSSATLRDFHGPRTELLASAGPDLLAVETIPDADEPKVLVPLLDELGLPAWFSYSVEGAATRAGQPLREAYAGPGRQHEHRGGGGELLGAAQGVEDGHHGGRGRRSPDRPLPEPRRAGTARPTRGAGKRRTTPGSRTAGSRQERA